MGTLRRLWASAGFRLAFQYAVLVAITMMAALAIVYLQTVGVLHQRIARQVGATVQQLVARFDGEGAAGVVQAIDAALADGRQSDEEMYLLAAPDGRRLAGNLDALPEGIGDSDGQRRALRRGEVVTGYLAQRRLADGHVLVVGHDLRDQEALESLVVSASAAAGVVALLLLVGGVFVFRQELDRAVGAVRHTATRIADGDLRERVVVEAQDDEFARLGQDINAMLDRIESLMAGVRHVSDTIAHNLRTPLTRVLLGLRAAQAQGVPAAERERAVATAIRELEELGAVFDKLLQIAEAEAGARRRDFGPVALHTIVGDVLELYDAVAEAQGATLQREAGDEEVVVPGDRDLLAGVVANLVDNALKYGGAGCTVVVGVRWNDGRAVLTVRDDGPGVPAAERERIGTRFLRLMPELPGQGLGLASVRAVVALHGGRIGYADAGPGLIVRLEFPVRG